MTPILIAPSLYWACAAPAAAQAAASAIAVVTEGRIPFLLLHTKVGPQFFPTRLERSVGDHVDNPPVLDDVVPVRHRFGEAEILLHQQDREALPAQHANGIADLLDDDGRQTLRRLVQQQQLGAGAQD